MVYYLCRFPMSNLVRLGNDNSILWVDYCTNCLAVQHTGQRAWIATIANDDPLAAVLRCLERTRVHESKVLCDRVVDCELVVLGCRWRGSWVSTVNAVVGVCGFEDGVNSQLARLHHRATVG